MNTLRLVPLALLAGCASSGLPFVGRHHFDDPDLLERRFELDLGEAP